MRFAIFSSMGNTTWDDVLIVPTMFAGKNLRGMLDTLIDKVAPALRQ